MTNERKATQAFVDRLLGAGGEPFSADELDAALSWLAGSRRHGGESLQRVLGAAPDHPRRRIAVYEQLDWQLFDDGALHLVGAHVDIDVDRDTRRARYRRLMTAFHPDRYPEHAEWLTSRSQAVHASYARFRKGKAPEWREPDPRQRRTGMDARPAPPGGRRDRQGDWPRDRRSARLVPVPGDGPLTRLRSWLLGIDNLQQRILVGLAVICLVPVLYAYFAYKPYRAIQVPDTPVVETDPQPDPPAAAAGEAGDEASVADAGLPPESSELIESAGRVGALADAAGQRAEAPDSDPRGSDTGPADFPPIRPVRDRPGEAEGESVSESQAGSGSGPDTGSDAVVDSAPDPEAALAQVTEWAEPLAEAATGLVEGVDGEPQAAEPDGRDSAPQPGPDAENEPVQDPEAAWTELAEWADPLVDATAGWFQAGDPPPAPGARGERPEPAGPAVAGLSETGSAEAPPGDEAPAPSEDALPERDADGDDTEAGDAPGGEAERTIAAVGDTPQAASPGADSGGHPETAPTPEPQPLPDTPESQSDAASGADVAAETGATTLSTGSAESRAGAADAAENVERVVAEADSADAGSGETRANDEPTPADRPELDETSRRHIEELLTGYRRSFENGWLDDFLDHFTESPRENRHEGRDWFRSNYGWLFENSEQRRLDIDILDIDRAGDHWRVMTRFEMQVDYPDRPAVSSARKVHYRIQTNEHDQFRIAAIEY